MTGKIAEFIGEMRKQLYNYLPAKINTSAFILDRSSGLPIWASILPQVEEAMERFPVAMLYIDLESFKNIEALYGSNNCQQILLNTGNALKTTEIDFYGIRKKIAVACLGGDDFLIFVDALEDTPDFKIHFGLLRSQLEQAINDANHEYCQNDRLSIHLGYIDLCKIALAPIESIVYEATREAIFVAKSFSEANEHAEWHFMKQVLEKGMIRPGYQPIASLKSGKVLGYEVLSRGPENTELASPATLFKLAERYKCLLELEVLCHKKAVEGIGKDLGDHFLFLNISPSILATGKYRYTLNEMLRSRGINPKKVVLELTERDPIEDYAEFRELINAYRSDGYHIAIDDAGAGYSSLQAIAELQAEFVKVDLSLVCDIDKNPTKRALLETLAQFCSKVGSRIICEGIETPDELKVLSALGLDYGQGYFIARPGEWGFEINEQVQNRVQSQLNFFRKEFGLSQCIGDLIMYQNPVLPDTPVEKIIEMFNHNKAINGLVVCEKGIPLGLIMRDRLFYTLGTRYGYEILTKRRAKDIMDRDPLIISHLTPVEEAARFIAERINQGINDYLIVVKDSTYFGVVSTAKMLNSMAQIQIEQAKDANPLTGLPGNRCITRRISDGLHQGEEFSVLYVDIDNFKAFNDYFGFEYGDRALLFLSDILSEVMGGLMTGNDLLGHIGGDDFIIITEIKKAESTAREIIKQFEMRIGELYDPAILEQGFILTFDRQGKLVRVPNMTLSIAGVNNYSKNPFQNHLALAETAAEVKKMVKAKPGCAYLLDRREPPVKKFGVIVGCRQE